MVSNTFWAGLQIDSHITQEFDAGCDKSCVISEKSRTASWCNLLFAVRRTCHACLMKRGEGKQWRIDCCTILQQQFDTIQAPRCACIAQRGAAVNVTSIHLSDRVIMRSRPFNEEASPDSVCETIWPAHQRPAAVWHIESDPVYRPRAAGWWSPQPQCWQRPLPGWAAAAGGLCPEQQPHEPLSALSRTQGHELKKRKGSTRLSQAWVFSAWLNFRLMYL